MSLELDEETLAELGFGDAVDYREVRHVFSPRSGSEGLVGDPPKPWADKEAQRRSRSDYRQRRAQRYARHAESNRLTKQKERAAWTTERKAAWATYQREYRRKAASRAASAKAAARPDNEAPNAADGQGEAL